MKILILQGSPRANGNTAWMAEEYKKAAEAAGHEVTLVNVAKKKIAGCLACEYCHNKGNGACIQKDDMQELYPLMNEAEVLVLAAPIYYFTLCAQIQAPIQRMYCVNKPANVKKIVMMLVALLTMSLSACSQKKENKEMKKVLVAYFSASGVTKGVAFTPSQYRLSFSFRSSNA